MKLAENVKAVCREAFASLHGVGTKRIRRVSLLMAQGTTPKDKRGKHNNHHFISDACRQKVDDHIRKFPFRVSHYAGHGNKRRYLSSELNILTMYTMFLEDFCPKHSELYKEAGEDPQKLDCEVKYRFYYDHYRANFNYGFGRPDSDLCTICAELKTSIKLEKSSAPRRLLKNKLALHKSKAKVFYSKLLVKGKLAVEREDTECLCFDFKQNMPFPHIATGDVFYIRQLWLFVFGIHSSKTGKCRLYTWPETQAKRGVNEVVSSLNDYITKYVDEKIRNLYIFTDGCRGQNHNNTMVQYLHSLVISGRFDFIQHQLPMRGHSYLPCDREFGRIELRQRRRDHVELYTGWNEMLEERNELTRMAGTDMRDYRSHLQGFYKKSTKGWRVTFNKVFQFDTHHKFEIKASENMNGNILQCYKLIKPGALTITLPVAPLYREQLGVNPKKLKDVRGLAKYLETVARDFIGQLKEAGTAPEDDDNASDYGDGE